MLESRLRMLKTAAPPAVVRVEASDVPGNPWLGPGQMWPPALAEAPTVGGGRAARSVRWAEPMDAGCSVSATRRNGEPCVATQCNRLQRDMAVGRADGPR